MILSIKKNQTIMHVYRLKLWCCYFYKKPWQHCSLQQIHCIRYEHYSFVTLRQYKYGCFLRFSIQTQSIWRKARTFCAYLHCNLMWVFVGCLLRTQGRSLNPDKTKSFKNKKKTIFSLKKPS